MTQQDARICPRPGHLVRSNPDPGPGGFKEKSNTGLVVAARGIEVQIMINGRLTWIRRDRLEVVHGDSTESN